MRFEGESRWIQFRGQDSEISDFGTPMYSPIFRPSRVYVFEYMQHILCLHILLEPCAFREHRLALWNHQGTDCVSLCFYSSSCSALKSNTRLLSCYLVIFIVFSLRNAMQHPEGYNKYPGPSLSSITHSRQWWQERGEGGKQKGLFYVWTRTEGNFQLTIYCNDEPN